MTKIISLEQLLKEYVEHRNYQNDEEKKIRATNITSCRQNFIDILNVMGIKIDILKDCQTKRFYQFVETDKHLVFRLLDDFTSHDFTLMRKGKYLEVPIKSLRFYLKIFATLLEHHDIDCNEIEIQKKLMMRHTNYELAVELHNIQALMTGIQDDINKIIEDNIEELNEFIYSDSIVLLKDLGSYLHSLRERTRYLFYFMDSNRNHEDLKIGSQLIKKNPDINEFIKNNIRLESALNKNKIFLELQEKLEKLMKEGFFSRSKYAASIKVKNEMYTIFVETQIKEFGKQILPSSENFKVENSPRTSSKDALIQAIDSYRHTLILKKNATDPRHLPMTIDLVAKLFNEKMKGCKLMNTTSIYNIVHHAYQDSDWDWDDILTDAYDEYLEFSDSEQKEFDLLVTRGVAETKELFDSFPKMFQTQLDLDISEEIQEEISSKLELIFEKFI